MWGQYNSISGTTVYPSGLNVHIGVTPLQPGLSKDEEHHMT